LRWSDEQWSQWVSMPRMSTMVIPRTRFLLLKAPVSTLYEEKYGGDRNVFTVPMFAERAIAKSWNIGSVIDCTLLDSYIFENGNDFKMDINEEVEVVRQYFHDENEWEDFGIEHFFLPSLSDSSSSSYLMNASMIPSDDVLDEFTKLCKTHWENQPSTFIAIYDSRGGCGIASYLACHYACSILGAPVHVALAALRKSFRNMHLGLCDVNLLQDLQKRHDGLKEIIYTPSEIPSWLRRTNQEDDSKIIKIPPAASCSSCPSNKRDNTNQHTSNPTHNKRAQISNDDVQSQTKPKIAELRKLLPQSQSYERAIYVLNQLTCKRPKNKDKSTNTKNIFEQLPISSHTCIHSKNISSLFQNNHYKVTWTPRGRRALLLILSEGSFFIESGENNNIQISILEVKFMHFPLPKTHYHASHPPSSNPTNRHHRTLLDGTLVLDSDGPRYMASDALCHMGVILTSMPLKKRMGYLMDSIIIPRKKDAQRDYSLEPIRLRAQEYFDLGKTNFVLNNVRRGVQHLTHGIEFVSTDSGYYGSNVELGGKIVWRDDGDVSSDDLLQFITSLM